MRVMSFNLRSDFILDINNRWSNRLHIVISLIKYYKPDIIGVQELSSIMRMDLIEELKDYYIVGKSRSKKIFSEGNDIFISKEFKIKSYETFWLSKTPKEISYSSWYSIFPRICTVAKITNKEGKSIRICNSHLDFLFSKAREKEIKRILNYIENENNKEEIPTILMGDFNASPRSKVVKEIKEYNYNSKKFIACGDVNNKLYNHTTLGKFKGRKKGIHIDYIFATNDLNIIDSEVITFNVDSKYPSDHYPLFCIIE